MQVGKLKKNKLLWALILCILIGTPLLSNAQGKLCISDYKMLCERFEEDYTLSDYYLLQESYFTQNGADGKTTVVEVINKGNEFALISDYLSIYKNDDFAITISHLEKKAIIKPYSNKEKDQTEKAVMPYELMAKHGITPTCLTSNHIELLFSDSAYTITGIKKVVYFTNDQNRVNQIDKHYHKLGYDMIEHTLYKKYIPNIGDKKYVFTQFKNEIIENILSGKYLDYSITDLR